MVECGTARTTATNGRTCQMTATGNKTKVARWLVVGGGREGGREQVVDCRLTRRVLMDGDADDKQGSRRTGISDDEDEEQGNEFYRSVIERALGICSRLFGWMDR